MFRTGHMLWMGVSIIVAIGCFWSLGVMHNYATDLAKKRSSYRGGYYDFTKEEADMVPNWISWINLLFSLAGLILFVTGVVFYL
jgi:hypothetical protein